MTKNLTITAFPFALPDPKPARAEDARIPALIPNIRECDYLVEFWFQSGAYIGADGEKISDDAMADMLISRQQDPLSASSLLIKLPLEHMAHDQSMREMAAQLRDGGAVGVEVHRAIARITTSGPAYALRLAWLHTNAPDGASWGSNNWTPEKGKRSAETMAEFERLNPGRFW